jgi:hypothetical protein
MRSLMQTLDIHNPGIPDLQFVLMIGALCTSDIPTLNVPEEVRRLVFDRCWAMLHNTPSPEEPTQRVLDLREGEEVTLEALVEVIRSTFMDQGYEQLTWESTPNETTQSNTPEVQSLIDRLQKWDPVNPPPVDGASEAGNN